MAKKAAAKRRSRRADTSKFKSGAKVEGLDNVAKLAASAAGSKGPGPGHNSHGIGITDDELKRQVESCEDAFDDLQKAMKIVDKARGAYRSALKVAKDKGAPKDEIAKYLQMKKLRGDQGDGVVVTEHRNMNRIMRVMGDPLGTQYNLFGVQGDDAAEDTAGRPPLSKMDAGLQGQHAYHNGEPRENNPFDAGTENFVEWDLHWERAMLANVPGAKQAAANGATAAK